MAGTLGVTGNADLNGDLDVDGTTNLDVVDIDGAVDMASTLNVAGLVGIGTSSPSFENGTGLEIRYAGGNGAHLKLTDNASGAGGSNGFDLYAFNTSGYIENYEAGSIIFRNNGAENMRINSSGYAKFSNNGSYIGSTGEYHEFNTNDVGDANLHIRSTHASYTGDILQPVTSRSNNSGFRFLRAFSGGEADIEFTLRGDGEAYADGSWNAGGADYAEYFEWKDGNTNNEDRRGYTVVLDGNEIRKSTSDDDASTIIGAISGNPSVVGDNAWNAWSNKYQKDDYGSYVRDSNGSRVLNTDYDEAQEYVTREDRQEWDIVGLMGKLKIKVGQTVGDRWIKMREISDTVHEYLVR
jgi:hypothetical protein